LLCKREWIEEALQHVLTNDGSHTPGVDGMSWKDFNDAEKSDFEHEQFRPHFIDEVQAELKTHTFPPLPVRRVEIPKPGTHKTRPLGMPTVKDRTVQTLRKMVTRANLGSRLLLLRQWVSAWTLYDGLHPTTLQTRWNQNRIPMGDRSRCASLLRQNSARTPLKGSGATDCRYRNSHPHSALSQKRHHDRENAGTKRSLDTPGRDSICVVGEHLPASL
jgi:hypothetical protein